ncbi:MAG: alpha/beta hydrolase [Ignavibacteria bacterium]|nr:alpha/beta hydrolase [Ignavibacteria bacterium]
MGKPDLLLLHGALGCKAQLDKLRDVLADEFTLHTLDFTGHGGSEIPTEPFSIEMFASDIKRWQDASGVDEVNIFGYSMGGYAAMWYAKQNPKRTRKIFTLAAKFEWTPDIAEREVKMLDPGTIKEKVPKYAEVLMQRHGADKWETVLSKSAEMMRTLGADNTLTAEDYADMENEVLVAVGDSDKMVTIEETVSVYRKLRHGRMLVMPGTPHPLEHVDADKLACEIEEFFAG